MNNLEFMSKFKPDKNCLKEFNYWIVCLRGKQATIGDAVILLKREVPSLADMSAEEAGEFPIVVKWYEDLCKDKFGAVKFNYFAIMMKDFYVHYHAFPRYDRDIDMFGITWTDKDYPLGVNYKEGLVLEDDTLCKLKDYMIS